MAINQSDLLKKLNNNLHELWPGKANTASQKPQNVNISDQERLISSIAGGMLVVYGVTRFSLPGLAIAGVGADLLYRGSSGQSLFYKLMKVNTSRQGENPNSAVKAARSIKVRRAMTINKPAEELYNFWRNFENLPRIMEHLESVRTLDDKRSHWIAKAPAGTVVEWDAEIINEKPNELIAWQSLSGASVANAGSVQFKPAPGDNGTEVLVEIDYEPPAGPIGAVVAKLFGEEPGQQVQEDLRHFKQMMEAGEIPTTKGQPTCRENK
ncbi:MAG TPA: SRPBCC family protein [Chloroflexia bacterium]|nr:SRPBCC family protein [Chloroflexia bacterium]